MSEAQGFGKWGVGPDVIIRDVLLGNVNARLRVQSVLLTSCKDGLVISLWSTCSTQLQVLAVHVL